MYKFVKQYVETTAGASVYAIISLLIFFIFFVALLWYVKTLDKKSIDTLSNIPFDSTEIQPSIN